MQRNLKKAGYTKNCIVLEMLMEIGFQEVVNERGYEALLEKQGLNEK